MSKGYAGAATSANLRGVQSEPLSVPNGTNTLSVMRVARRLFQTKLVPELIAITGASESTVKRWLRGERDMSFDHFHKLLHSKHGLHFLMSSMQGCNERWWRVLKAVVGTTIARKILAKANEITRDAMSGFLDAEKQAVGSFHRTEALVVQDADFLGEHFAMRDAFYSENGPVAAETKRRK